MNVTVITSARKKSSLICNIRELFTDLNRSKELAWVLFMRNLKAQFRQSFIGYAWLFLPPLVNSAVWLVLQGSGVVSIMDSGVPYPLFVITGTLLWQSFHDSLIKPLGALSSNRDMLIKLNFPREAPILASIAEVGLNAAIRILILIPVFLFYGVPISISILFFPVAYLCLILLGSGVGVLLTPIGLLYNDIAKGLALAAQFLMYATPVVYPAATGGLLGVINRWNPITYPLVNAREALLGQSLSGLPQFVVIFVLSVFGLLVAWAIQKAVLPKIIERLGM